MLLLLLLPLLLLHYSRLHYAPRLLHLLQPILFLLHLISCRQERLRGH